MNILCLFHWASVADEYCPRCGKYLGKSPKFCPKCRHRGHQRYCRWCGTKLRQP